MASVCVPAAMAIETKLAAQIPLASMEFSPHGEIFIRPNQGVRHAEWPRTMTDTHQHKTMTPNANRRRWTAKAARPEARGSEPAQRSYERYLALAQAQAQAGDRVGAESYYQHAEHYFRSMSKVPEPV
jgi:Domain of unknown function (DUF4167)